MQVIQSPEHLLDVHRYNRLCERAVAMAFDKIF